MEPLTVFPPIRPLDGSALRSAPVTHRLMDSNFGPVPPLHFHIFAHLYELILMLDIDAIEFDAIKQIQFL